MNIAHADRRSLRHRDDDAEQQNERRGNRTAHLVEIPYRTDDTSRLLIHLEIARALLQ